MQETHILKITCKMLGISRDMVAVGLLSTERIYLDFVTPGAEPCGSLVAGFFRPKLIRDRCLAN